MNKYTWASLVVRRQNDSFSKPMGEENSNMHEFIIVD